MAFIETLIKLPYTSPGDDLQNCIVEDNDGIVNVKITLNNMIKLLKTSIKQLKNINDLIPIHNTLDIYGNGESIGMSGDNDVVQALLFSGLVIEGEFEENDEAYCDETSNGNSETDSDSD